MPGWAWSICESPADFAERLYWRWTLVVEGIFDALVEQFL
jgi:hypothetical protein